MADSKSRKVNGYVRAKRLEQALLNKYGAKLEALRPLKVKLDLATADALTRYRALTGGQIAEAQRILDAATLVAREEKH